jgi:hypothetical protein
MGKRRKNNEVATVTEVGHGPLHGEPVPAALPASVPATVEDTVRLLASQRRRPTVIARALGLSLAQFQEQIMNNPLVAAAYEEGRDLARDSYLQSVMRAAFKDDGSVRNPTMAIWAGKIAHGYTEEGQEADRRGGGSRHVHFHLPTPQSVDDFKKLTAKVTDVPSS